jgi:hypothetical protein
MASRIMSKERGLEYQKNSLKKSLTNGCKEYKILYGVSKR